MSVCVDVGTYVIYIYIYKFANDYIIEKLRRALRVCLI